MQVCKIIFPNSICVEHLQLSFFCYNILSLLAVKYFYEKNSIADSDKVINVFGSGRCSSKCNLIDSHPRIRSHSLFCTVLLLINEFNHFLMKHLEMLGFWKVLEDNWLKRGSEFNFKIFSTRWCYILRIQINEPLIFRIFFSHKSFSHDCILTPKSILNTVYRTFTKLVKKTKICKKESW